MKEVLMQVKTKLIVRGVSLLLVNFLAVKLAIADSSHEDSNASRWGVGVFVGSEKTPYKSFDNKTEVLPMLTYENQWVRVVGPGVDVKMGSAGPLSFELTAKYSNAGYQASDSIYLEGMDTRNASIWFGGRVNWKNDFANLSAELLADGSGNSNGQQFKLGVDKHFQLGSVHWVPRLGINWQDQKYVDYYYGVKASEVRTDRAAYVGESGVSTELGLRVSYTVAPKHTVFMDLSATALPTSIKNSPLVDSSTQSAVRVGYLYSF
jgi:outer membrane scaffolding protein for murein synthesis (MipA/OmpV family)